MIVFDLKCSMAHTFEAWFGSSSDYEAQKARGLVSCPIGGADEVEKAVMAPAVSPKGNRISVHAEREAEADRLRALRTEVEANCDYVGRAFASEARARHELGEGADRAPRGIYGEASLLEAAELISDGIPVAPLPFRPRRLADA